MIAGGSFGRAVRGRPLASRVGVLAVVLVPCRAVKSSVSIVLFFLLSGFFLTVLLGAIEHSRKLLLLSSGCLAAIVCIIVFLAPVQLPSLHLGGKKVTTTTTSVLMTTTTTLSTPLNSEPFGAQSP